jgi:hypothetical protein
LDGEATHGKANWWHMAGASGSVLGDLVTDLGQVLVRPAHPREWMVKRWTSLSLV